MFELKITPSQNVVAGLEFLSFGKLNISEANYFRLSIGT